MSSILFILLILSKPLRLVNANARGEGLLDGGDDIGIRRSVGSSPIRLTAELFRGVLIDGRD